MRLSRLYITLVILIAIPVIASAAAPWNTLVVGRQTEPEKLATIDLQRYIAQVTGKTPIRLTVSDWQAHPSPAVILGSPESNPLLRQYPLPRRKMGEQGYYLANTRLRGAPVVVVAGLTGEGATNAIYGLLRELGFGFYLGSESIPDSIPAKLPQDAVARQPVFNIRGVLPWYNFFNSPTAWDPIDHRAFVDQLVRTGANFVGFHTYDHEPFAAYEENGKMHWGARLLSTNTPNWGTASLPTSKFGFGTNNLFTQNYFGAESTSDKIDANTAIKLEQDIMRDALDYAKRRGLRTCLGFEMHGDPLDPTDRDVFLKRLNHVLDQYPSLDYIWIWQSETTGVTGYSVPAPPGQPTSILPLYAMARRDIFHRVVDESAGEAYFYRREEEGKMARATEGARLEQYSLLAYRALSHRKDPPKLVISGWGGDQRLLSAEYYDGLDKLLPKDVVFASLDHISPRDRVDRIYGELPPGRQRWPIPWLENDGDQWQPQPYVHTYESLVRDAHKGGSQGILGIHWRTRDVEENFAFLTQYAWDPSLTAEGFFRDYAARCYDTRIAPQMAAIHSELDRLGIRWVGGAGQIECGGFNWGPGEENKANQLRDLQQKATALLPQAGKGKARLDWLIKEIGWVLNYREAELDAVEINRLLSEAAATDDPAKARLVRRIALTSLHDEKLETALRTYATRVTTRGEYGVLATINAKALVAWRDLRSKLKYADGKETTTQWNPTPQILLPRFLASAPAGRSLELQPIVLGGGKSWLHYRMLSGKHWITQETRLVEGKWVGSAAIPATAMVPPGVEITFSFSPDLSAPAAYGPVGVTVLPSARPETTPRPRVKTAPAGKIRLTSKPSGIFPATLTWNEIPEADYYKVLRDGKAIAETGATFLPDLPDRQTNHYTVEAWRDGKPISKSAVETVVITQQIPEETFEISAYANNKMVVLEWPKAGSPYVTSYRISRAPASKAGEETALGTAPASPFRGHRYWDAPPVGDWEYRVTPLNAAGQPGKPIIASVRFAPRDGIAPVLDFKLNATPDAAAVIGDVSFGESGARFNGGYLVIPHKDAFNLGHGLTVAFDFQADSVAQMPVLLCQGGWNEDGWFVQILSGSLIVRTPAGDALGPMIEAGRKYSVRFVYDGANYHLWIDGKAVPQGKLWAKDTPTGRDLIIGQYESRGPDFAFHGTIGNVRIYGDAVMENDAAQ